jgi:SSS family solute:Na+ symporter
VGGIKAVIWTDAIEGVILIAGELTCVVVLLLSIPGGIPGFIEAGSRYDKFSLGDFGAGMDTSTFWVVLVYGVFMNLQNYGIDQNYVQRYKAARDDKGARFSALFGGLLYLPVSLLFFIIGAALFVYYKAQPDAIVDTLKPDQVFPYFIVNGLPTGVTGLLIAAIFAAGMSTISTSVNSASTVILTDFIKRKNKDLGERSSMKALYGTSLLLGLSGMGVGLAMMSAQNALDTWWGLTGIFSGGMLGLFLLGYLSRKVKRGAALTGAVCGVSLIGWMTLSGQTIFHHYMVTVLGTLTIFCVGFLIAFAAGAIRKRRSAKG